MLCLCKIFDCKKYKSYYIIKLINNHTKNINDLRSISFKFQDTS